ncbi:YqaA family protein [Kordiimonas pumila]|uniref:YqaA family protein n=1 Tax=Kordiimonas pumila TaxID=2161677 RepID=A0ABV7D997_9PROT|nr:YqaA family protein [Kordiimonas pumila]
MSDLLIYLGLFWNAFLAATILPVFSELALAGLLAEDIGSPLLLFLFATAGNVAGSILNWWVGSRITIFQHKRWFPVRPNQLAKAEKYFARYGVWSLLLAWLPIIGDPITLVAGVLKTPFTIFLVLVAISKASRYAFIVAGFHFWG